MNFIINSCAWNFYSWRIFLRNMRFTNIWTSAYQTCIHCVAKGVLTMTGMYNGLARRMKFSIAQHSKTGTRLIRLVSVINFIVPEVCILKNVHLFFSILTLHVNICYITRTFKFVDYSATGYWGIELFYERTFSLNKPTRSLGNRIWKATR